jgi:serine/threonine protein kinase
MWHGTGVAVKVLKQELHLDLTPAIAGDMGKEHGQQKEREMFEQEAELLATLRHPNIVNFLGFSLRDHTVWPRKPSLCTVSLDFSSPAW